MHDRNTRDDRTVHAVTYKGVEIVRYDRAGKWYIEWPDEVRGVGARMRSQATLSAAAKMAVEYGQRIIFGLPGGAAFDAKVRRLRGF
jgi:hypothetical protein